MNIRDFFRRPVPRPNSRHVAREVRIPQMPPDPRIFSEHGLRQGMWVRFQGRTAILTHANAQGVGEIHILDDTGMTVLVDHVPLTDLTQAALSEIPANRRPDAAVAAALGYK